MDDIVRTPAELPKTISDAERARRKAAIDYARGSIRLEGFVVSPTVDDLSRRYVDGEITLEEHSAAIRRRHGL